MKGMRISICKVFLFIHANNFTAHKILRHETSGFTYPLKEGVLWIFITFKNQVPLTSLNPQTLDLMASSLTIKQAR
jgi:hypothetical protein